ncbi:MAG: fimbrillin family protein [Alistipes sp.]
MRKILVSMAILAIGFSACSKDDHTGGSEQRCVTIDPTITRANETDFEKNDAIGVTITTAAATYADNKKFLFGDDKKFAAEGGLLWYEDVNAKSTIFAYYPYNTTSPTEFTVAADQNGVGYEASNYMSASKKDVLPSVNATAMTFKHKMARLVINVTNETNTPIEKITVKNTIGTATINFTDNTLSAKAGGAMLDIVARQITPNVKYMALLVPQSATLKIAVTTAGGTRTQGFNESVLESGKQYPLSVRVLANNIALTLGGPIEGWIDGTELLPDGQTPPVDNSLEYGGVKYKTVTMKDGRVWMAENLRYIPAGATVSTDPVDNNAAIWAPYSSDGTTATALTDAAEIAKIGYLYSFDTAFGTAITPENCATFEGARGICPEGWHIPSQADWVGLIGATVKTEAGVDLTDTTAPYYDATYKGANIATLNADKYNFVFSGIRMRSMIASAGVYQKNVYDAHISLSYVMCSTVCKKLYSKDDATVLTNIQYFAPMTMFSTNFPDGKLSVALLGYKSGVAVRCVKDVKK